MAPQQDNNTVSIAAAIDVIHACINANIITEHDLKPLNLSIDKLKDLSLRIPESDLIRLWRLIFEQCADNDIALNIGQTINPNAKGLLASWVSQTSTLREALTTFIKHISLMNPSEHWQLDEHQGICTLALKINSEKNYPRMATERSMSAMIAWGKVLSSQRFTVMKVQFSFSAPTYLNRFIEIFGDNIIFNSNQDALVFHSHVLDLPVVSSNFLLKEIIEDKAKNAFKALNADTSPPEKVRLLIIESIEQQKPTSIQIISDALAISRQTLYRDLKKHNTDFQSLFESIRKDEAMRLLTSSSDSIETISLKLGYKDSSSFYKAFKRWYGQSPAAFKRAHS